MLKLKFLFAALFILAILQVFPPNHVVGKKMAVTKETELQSNFVESYAQILNLGEVSTGDATISVYSTSNENYFSNSKVKDFQTALNCTLARNNFFSSETPDSNSLCYRIELVPIYLQTRNFLL